MPPIMLPCCTSQCHNSSIGVFVDSRAQTRPIIVFGSWNKFQDASCGNGKWLWNSVWKWFDIKKSLNDRDTNSAIVFISPATWSVVKGDAQQCSIRSARIWSSCAAVVALVESSLEAHAMVGVLSHQHTTCACTKSVHSSKTIQCNNKLVISRSKFEMEPLGLPCVIICFCTSIRNSTLQTMGGSFFPMPNQTPPAPAWDASQ